MPIITALDKLKVGAFIAEGKRHGIDLSKHNFCHIDRSGPDYLRASLKAIIAQADRTALEGPQTAPTTSAAAPAAEIAGLAELLKSAGCEEKLSAAAQWCEDNGFRSVELLLRCDSAFLAEFVASLALKRGPKTLLEQELSKRQPGRTAKKSVSLPPEDGPSGGGSASSAPALGRQKSAGTLRMLLGGQLPGATGSGRRWSTKLREMRSGKLRDLYTAMGGSTRGGGAAAAAADDDELNAELRGLLRKLKLEGKLATMRAWCDDEEVDSLADLARAVRRKAFADSLIAKLELKPGKTKALNLLEDIEKAGQAEAPPTARQLSGRI